MKVTIQAGAEVDILTAAEARAETDRLVDQLRRNGSLPTIMYPGASAKVDAAGELGGGKHGDGANIYLCPAGMLAFVTRIVIDDDIRTPAAPQTAGWLQFYRNKPSRMASVLTLPPPGTTTVYPTTIEDSESAAFVLRSGDRLMVAGAGLVVDREIGFTLQLRLYPTTTPDDEGRAPNEGTR